MIWLLFFFFFDWHPAEIECGDPETPLNALVRSSSRNLQVDFECSIGYILDGSASRHCQPNGLWSGQQPICKGTLPLLILILAPASFVHLLLVLSTCNVGTWRTYHFVFICPHASSSHVSIMQKCTVPLDPDRSRLTLQVPARHWWLATNRLSKMFVRQVATQSPLPVFIVRPDFVWSVFAIDPSRVCPTVNSKQASLQSVNVIKI